MNQKYLKSTAASKLFMQQQSDDEEEEEDYTKNSKYCKKGSSKFLAPANNKTSNKDAKIISQAIIDDPSIYQFDSIYDDIKDSKNGYGLQAKKQVKNQAQPKRQSRYISKLIKQNERRKIENLISIQNIESKQRRRQQQKNPGLKNKKEEVFITQSYVKQLKLNKKHQNIVDIQQQVNKHKSGGDLSNFYSKLLSENKAMAGGARSDVFTQYSHSGGQNEQKTLCDKIEDLIDEKHKLKNKFQEQKTQGGQFKLIKINQRQSLNNNLRDDHESKRSRSLSHERQQVKDKNKEKLNKLLEAKQRYKRRKQNKDKTANEVQL